MATSLKFVYIEAFVRNPWSSWPFQAFPANAFVGYTAQQLQEARRAWGLFEATEALDAAIRIRLAGTNPGTLNITDPDIWTDLEIESIKEEYKYGQYLHTFVCPEILWDSQRNQGIPAAGIIYLTLKLTSVSSVVVSSTPTTVIPENGAVLVIWNSFSQNVTKYKVTSVPGNRVAYNAGPSSLSALVTDLSNGTPYTFIIEGTDNNGIPTLPVITASVIPYTNPGRPTILTAVGGSFRASLTWTAVTDGANGNGGPLVYTLMSTTNNIIYTTTDTSATITGLTEGYGYRFFVYATNKFGLDSESSALSNLITTMIKPSEPRNIQVTAANASVIVSWTPPLNSGSGVILSYTVTVNPGSYQLVVNDTSGIVVGLINGLTYTCSVFATNESGNSISSNTSRPFIPASVPGSPIVTAITTPGVDNSISLSWAPPVENGGFPVLFYKYYSSVNSVQVSTLTRSAVFPNLLNGTTYIYYVIATNRMGDSAPGISLPIISISIPYPVTIRSIVQTGITGIAPATSPVISLYITPVNNGGSIITSYTIFWTNGTTPNSRIISTTSPGYSTDSSGVILTVSGAGLVNAREYRNITVIATNNRGPSLASLPVSITTWALSGSPTALNIVPGNKRLRLNWSPPLDTGGVSISGYNIKILQGTSTVFFNSNVGVTVADIITQLFTTFVDQSVSPAAVTPLAINTLYTIYIAAINPVGIGQYVSITGTTWAIPGIPTNAQVIVGNQQLRIQWSAPLNDGGSSITGYIGSAYITTPANLLLTYTDNSGTLSYTFTNLINGQLYNINIAAVSAVGIGPILTTSGIPVTLPGPVTNLTTTFSNRTITLLWRAPISNGGASIDTYVPRNLTTGFIPPPPILDISNGFFYYTFRDLSNGTPYNFSVVARNSVGDSTPVNISTTPYSVPDAVIDLSANFGNKSVTLRWRAPYNGGAAINRYFPVNITTNFRPAGLIPDLSNGVFSYTFRDLSNGTLYAFSVAASNFIGTGPTVTVSTIPMTVPGQITVITAVSSNRSIIFYWSAPDNGGAEIEGYIPVNTTNNTRFGLVSETSNGSYYYVFRDLTNGVPFSGSIIARNIVGEGLPSNTLTRIPFTLPDVVTGISTLVSSRTVTLNWTPANNNGSPITGYRITRVDVTPNIIVAKPLPNLINGIYSYSITDLSNTVSYTFTITAENAAGFGPISNPVTAIPLGEPSIVTDISAVAGDRSVTLLWRAPDNGGVPITSYYPVNVTTNYYPPGINVSNIPVVNGYFQYTFGDISNSPLVNGTTYAFYIQAENARGFSPVAPYVYATPFSRPGSPINVSATFLDRSIILRWSPSTFISGIPIDYYIVQIISPSLYATQPVNVSDLSYNFTNLFNGTIYTFSIIARNRVGDSSPTIFEAITEPMTLLFDISSTLITLPISGILGTLIIDWGNGIPVITGNNLTNTTSGSIVKIYGSFSGYGDKYTPIPGVDATGRINYRRYLKSVLSWGSNTPTTLAVGFSDCTALTSVPPPPSSVRNYSRMFDGASVFNSTLTWNPSTVTDMSFMFKDAKAFNNGNQPMIWNTSAVTVMAGMFFGADKFNQTLQFDTSRVLSIASMFSGATIFNNGNQPIAWTTSAVTEMESVFNGATAFNQALPWNTSSVTRMSWMFQNAISFNQNISWDVSKVERMESMFQNATSFNQTLTWNTIAVTIMPGMFQNATNFNSSLNFNTVAVNDMSSMFQNATSFNQTLNFDTGAVRNMTSMFSGATAFNRPLNFNTVRVLNMSNMFYGATAFNQSLASFNTGAVTNVSNMFYGATALYTYGLYLFNLSGWTVTSVTNKSNFFYVNGKDTTLLDPNSPFLLPMTLIFDTTNIQITIPISGIIGTLSIDWGNGNYVSSNNLTNTLLGTTVTIIGSFTGFGTTDFGTSTDNFRAHLTSVPSWGRSRLTSLYVAFQFCTKLRNVPIYIPSTVINLRGSFYGTAIFNQDLSSWNTDNVTDMRSMFISATAFNQNISSWNTARVIDMGNMFLYATSFNQALPWNTASVTAMDYMFSNATSFNQPLTTNGSIWNTSNVIEMNDMFRGATSFNQNLSTWTTSNVRDMPNMFNGATALYVNNLYRYNLRNWNVLKVTNNTNFFFINGVNTTLSDPNSPFLQQAPGQVTGVTIGAGFTEFIDVASITTPAVSVYLPATPSPNPTYSGISPLSEYIVSATGNASRTVSIATYNSSPTRILTTFTGLMYNTSYSITVAARNGGFTGTPSTPITFTPILPSAPTNVSAVAGNGQVTLSWNPPSTSGSGQIESYVILYRASFANNVTRINNATSPRLFTSLANGTTYFFSLYAKNNVGSGPVTGSVSATTPREPDAPTITSATLRIEPQTGFYNITVTWTTPFNGGSPLSRYEINWGPGFTEIPGLPNTYSLLLQPDSYTIYVRARNAIGAGPSSAGFPSPIPPPSIIQVGNGGLGILFATWRVPQTPIQYYIISEESYGQSNALLNNLEANAAAGTQLLLPFLDGYRVYPNPVSFSDPPHNFFTVASQYYYTRLGALSGNNLAYQSIRIYAVNTAGIRSQASIAVVNGDGGWNGKSYIVRES